MLKSPLGSRGKKRLTQPDQPCIYAIIVFRN
jgi:hypothetical protein